MKTVVSACKLSVSWLRDLSVSETADQVTFCVAGRYYNKEMNCVSGSLNLKTVFEGLDTSV